MAKKVILCILDGWGIAPDSPGNAITQANPKTFNYLSENFPNTKLLAAGPAVGLPEGMDGNSETGHLNIGAGRVVYQDLALINMSIADGSFFTNKTLLDTVKHINSFGSRLHLLGMIGSSGVHSFNEHLFALMLFAKSQNVKEVYLHLITDGRDSPPQEGLSQIKQVQEKIKKIGVGDIVSVLGRYYAMDRDKRWDRTQLAFDCLVGSGGGSDGDPISAVENSYSHGDTDEFIKPLAIGENLSESRVKAGDAVIFFNFRTDRPRQLTELFLKSNIPNLRFVTMTKYRKAFDNPVMFPTTTVTNTLGEIISNHHLLQLRAAETEKIAMVTYYFNGQSEQSFPGEARLFIDSLKIETYDLQPRMSTDKLIVEFTSRFINDGFRFAVINIACPDMVAHTGKIHETKEAILAADDALNSLVNLAKETDSYLLITADHGNAEELINLETGQVDTEHSNLPVPFILYHPTDYQLQLQSGKLGDIAPTILSLLELPQPPEMNGKNLIVRQ
ncbi:phosphoglycerate mutase (2,3-diphosphoglycerate-independent) [Candidatus Collierbacteria bacterium RIFOXYB2_FULL_46_14]|uniref:2,3-bisphosphoglycerate-independent phosphoglycerate mutase n=1 Tax=Candidatus Collierbacteria bacterium GW2011_GWA2_46_26 TaxID=1618381 RepID=A0A0G1PIQ2_9BACT|nr:MAG: 2,3-bisphosphoglycerate-independent phosphoglycerate mutase [Candidatus Collierbacteria bacterium GW2011_GWC2_44_13]KKU32674.1 MAG: 2,3-bisphosphoglycerate-independent phosphoglycerate mutase [Candidatus Collierbacteria bacterium GW2011_GWA2_46_26]OGD73250.1 MAG: phosphoglycerate mutase (2,3-diphosphoglycerate-independent) [Candidatus Collierbacteria bacterium RIFOXYB2_FULL_46_14]OGD76292.1 MAG: phosphoglycerate mutase (2,3-diphosphoglycerate-independent) [Candidatus Collierbacteria bact